jgi:hypothetical protein
LNLGLLAQTGDFAMSVIRYCAKGHWDDPGIPAYFATRRPQVILQMRAVERKRLSIQFCDCGAELLSECPSCKNPLSHGPNDGPPQHCRYCGGKFPWTKEVEAPSIPGPTVHAPTGITRDLAHGAKKVWDKVAPVAGKIVADVATKAATTEATSLLDKHRF